MKKSISNLITLVLACFGCLLALGLTIEHYHPKTLPCSVHGVGCAGTLASTYAQVGPIPTSLFGFGMYFVFAVLCWKRKGLLEADRADEEARARAYANLQSANLQGANLEGEAAGEPTPAPSTLLPEVRPTGALSPLKLAIRRSDQMIWMLAALGLGISWWLQYISIWQLSSFCPYCFTSALTVTTIFVLSSLDFMKEGRLTGEQKLLAGVVCLVVGLLLCIAVPEAVGIINHPPSTAPVSVAPLLRDVVIRPGLHMQGDPKAKYTLVEFADYFCPHCKEASEKIPDIMKAHPEVKLIFRSYPLGFPNVKFPHSDKAAVAAEAAALQGKFWEMHDFLFAHQKEMGDLTFTDEQFVNYAEQLGLDTAKFQHDFADSKLLARVIQDHDDGDQAGVDYTPSFYLVTPSGQVTKFVGDTELKKIMDDPKNQAWK